MISYILIYSEMQDHVFHHPPSLGSKVRQSTSVRSSQVPRPKLEVFKYQRGKTNNACVYIDI